MKRRRVTAAVKVAARESRHILWKLRCSWCGCIYTLKLFISTFLIHWSLFWSPRVICVLFTDNPGVKDHQ
jgi:hypothetical protein